MTIYHACGKARVPMCVTTDMARIPTGISDEYVEKDIMVEVGGQNLEFEYWHDVWWMVNGEYV
eukprot:1669544-Pyramimonas_sp.AAC.1